MNLNRYDLIWHTVFGDMYYWSIVYQLTVQKQKEMEKIIYVKEFETMYVLCNKVVWLHI